MIQRVQNPSFNSVSKPQQAPAPAPAEQSGDFFVPGEVLVRVKGGFDAPATDFADSYGAEVLHKFNLPEHGIQDNGELLQLDLPAGMSTEQAVEQMKNDPRVLYVEPNYIYHLQDQTTNTPNDLVEGLWGLNNTGQNAGTPDADIDAPEAWAKHTGSADGPIVAVIDTGVDYNHPDLKNNMWVNPGEVAGDGLDNDGNGVVDDVHGYNAYADNGNPLDGHSHGTHCAGTIAAEGNNAQGVVGVNHRARIQAIKIFSDSGSTNAAAITRGLLYANRNGARITSNSWGGGAASAAIKEAFEGGSALHIMAAGNNGSNNDVSPHYPSNYDIPNKVAVAASDRNDKRARFSNYGAASVEIAAPGKDILSTLPGGGTGSKSGTSMATPHVAGVATLIASAFPNASNEEIKTRLFEGADKLPEWQGVVAHGRLNANGALSWQPPAPPEPPAPQPPAGGETPA